MAWRLARSISEELNISEKTATVTLSGVLLILVTPVMVTLLFLRVLRREQLSDLKPYFDCLYDTSGLLLAMIAALALLAAIVQSREAVKARKASVIIKIESRWSSPELEGSRIRYQELVRKSRDIKALPQHSQEDFQRELNRNLHDKFLRNLVTEKLQILRNSTEQELNREYHEILALAGFFEYIGFLARRRYLSIRDIDLLFGPSCIRYYEDIWDHIEKLRELDKAVMGNNGGPNPARLAFENFSDLVKKLKECSGPQGFGEG